MNLSITANTYKETAILRTILILFLALLPGVALAATHEYTVRVSDDMTQLFVRAEFAQRVDSITARSPEAGRFLTDVRHCDSDARIRMRNRRMLLPSDGIRCVRYEVDLGQAAAAERRNRVLDESNVVVSPTVWLWRPSLSAGDRVVVHFDVDPSMGVSVPWSPMAGEPGSFVVQESPESSQALAAFGDFEYVERDIPGARLRITLLQPDGDMRSKELIDWVVSAASNVNLAYGRFPNPEPNIVILPVGSSGSDNDSAVYFGRVVRDGGETVELLINQSSPIDAFYDDWTATHEFSHLMMPYITENYRWMSEGFASYYQNILLARAGHYSETTAWQKLWEGFERGRQSRPNLSPNEAAREGVRLATMKIYWSGAVIALLADVELRQRSNGDESLDTVLDRLQHCCLPSESTWSGPEFFRKLDSMIDEPVFMPLYRRYANTSGFPDARPIFERLGIDIERDRVRLRSRGELVAVRRALTARP